MKKDKVDLDVIPTTNQDYISVPYGCVRYTGNNRNLFSSFHSLVETLIDNGNKPPEFLKKKELLVMMLVQPISLEEMIYCKVLMN